MCRLFGVVAIVASGVLLGACGSAVPHGASDGVYGGAQGDQVGSASVVSLSSVIGEEEAVRIALEHAGLDEGDVSFVRSHPDFDDSRGVYDVEFYAGSEEFDYEIDAVNGTVLSFDSDIDDGFVEDEASNGSSQGAGDVSGSAGGIAEDEAVNAALRRAGVSDSDVSSLFVSQEVDDGRSVFHVEFVVGYDEYDVDVDASTGSIVDYDVDKLRD